MMIGRQPMEFCLCYLPDADGQTCQTSAAQNSLHICGFGNCGKKASGRPCRKHAKTADSDFATR